MGARKLQEGEIVFDLGKFLPAGRTFWWSSEVDDMISALKEYMPAHVDKVATQESARSHVNFQVLHVALGGGISEKEFRFQASRVIAHQQASGRRSGAPKHHRAAS